MLSEEATLDVLLSMPFKLNDGNESSILTLVPAADGPRGESVQTRSLGLPILLPFNTPSEEDRLLGLLEPAFELGDNDITDIAVNIGLVPLLIFMLLNESPTAINIGEAPYKT
jgi:hypothetical protein